MFGRLAAEEDSDPDAFVFHRALVAWLEVRVAIIADGPRAQKSLRDFIPDGFFIPQQGMPE